VVPEGRAGVGGELRARDCDGRSSSEAGVGEGMNRPWVSSAARSMSCWFMAQAVHFPAGPGAAFGLGWDRLRSAS